MKEVSVVRGYATWWLHSWWCMWKGGLGAFGYDQQGKLVMIACTCGCVFWVQS